MKVWTSKVLQTASTELEYSGFKILREGFIDTPSSFAEANITNEAAAFTFVKSQSLFCSSLLGC